MHFLFLRFHPLLITLSLDPQNMDNHFKQIMIIYMQDHHLVCNSLHYKSMNFYIISFEFQNPQYHFTFNKYILVGNITEVEKKLTQFQETVSIISHMEKQFYHDNIIIIDDKQSISSISSTLQNGVSNKSLIQLGSTLFHMASTPDLCEGVLYLFSIKIQDKFIIRYKFL